MVGLLLRCPNTFVFEKGVFVKSEIDSTHIRWVPIHTYLKNRKLRK